MSIVAVVLTLAACEAAMPVALQEPIEVRVEGRVTDAETGAPIDSAPVYMTSGIPLLDEEVHASFTTDADGLYEISHRFDDECPGDLRLGAFYDLSEYRHESVDLECTDGTHRVSFELTRRDGADVGSGVID